MASDWTKPYSKILVMMILRDCLNVSSIYWRAVGAALVTCMHLSGTVADERWSARARNRLRERRRGAAASHCCGRRRFPLHDRRLRPGDRVDRVAGVWLSERAGLVDEEERRLRGCMFEFCDYATSRRRGRAMERAGRPGLSTLLAHRPRS